MSKTDPESGYFMSRDHNQEMFCYLDHRTIDMKYNIITDAHVTPGNVHDSVPYLKSIDRKMKRIDFKVEDI